MANSLTINDLKLLHGPEDLKKCRIYDAANVINSVTNTDDITFIERSLCEIMNKIVPDDYDNSIVIFGESLIEFHKVDDCTMGFKLVEIYNSSKLHKRDMYRDMRKVTTPFNKDPKMCVLIARGQAVCGSASFISIGPMTVGNNLDIQHSITFDTYKNNCMNNKDISKHITSIITNCDADFNTPFNFLRKSTSYDSIKFLDDVTKSFLIDWFKKNNPARYSQEELDRITNDSTTRNVELLEEYLNREQLTEEEYKLCETNIRNILAFDQASIMFRVMMALYTLFLTACDKSGIEVYTYKTDVIPINKNKKKKGKIKKINIPIMRLNASGNGSMIGKFSTANTFAQDNPMKCSLKFIGSDTDGSLAPELSEEFFLIHTMQSMQ